MFEIATSISNSLHADQKKIIIFTTPAKLSFKKKEPKFSFPLNCEKRANEKHCIKIFNSKRKNG